MYLKIVVSRITGCQVFPPVYSPHRGYLAVTKEGRERLKEGGIEGAYLGPDGRVHVPGKKVTLYSEPSPTKEEMEQVCHDFA